MAALKGGAEESRARGRAAGRGFTHLELKIFGAPGAFDLTHGPGAAHGGPGRPGGGAGHQLICSSALPVRLRVHVGAAPCLTD